MRSLRPRGRKRKEGSVRTGVVSKSEKRDFPAGPVVKKLPFIAGDTGSAPGWGAETPRALRPKEQSIKRKPHGHEFSKEFQNDLHPKKRKKRKPEDLVTADLPCNKRQAQRSACPFRTS